MLLILFQNKVHFKTKDMYVQMYLIFLRDLTLLYRESRKRFYQKQYDTVFTGEIKRGHVPEANKPKPEVRLCTVLPHEVVGATEVMLNLGTYMSSLRCEEECEVYTINLKPFRWIFIIRLPLKGFAYTCTKNSHLSKTPVTLKAHEFLVVRFLKFLGGRSRRPKILNLKP